MRFAAGATGGDMSAFFTDALAEPLEDLALCGVEMTLLACSTATTALSAGALAAVAARAPGRMIDVIEASRAALDHLGRPRVALFTPYVEAGTAALKAELEKGGVAVVTAKGLGLNTSPERFRTVARMTPESLVDEVLAMELDGAEAVFLGCCDLPTLAAIPLLEERLGRPVISMVQALFWAAMRALGHTTLPYRPGRLLAA